MSLSDFNPPESIKTKYATKIVDNRFYGNVKLSIREETIRTLKFALNNITFPNDSLYANTLHNLILLLTEKIIKDHCE